MERQGLESQPNGITRWILPLICIGIVAGLFQFTIFTFPDSFSYVADSAYLIIPGALTFLSVTLAINLVRKKHIDAKPIVLFAIAMLCYFGGEQLWTIYNSVLEVEPFPSAADFFYLSAYPFFAAFFLHYLRANRKTVSPKIILFGIAVSASLLYPTLLSTYEFNAEESNISIAVALAYPTLDAVLLGIAVISTLVLFQEGKNYFWIMVNLGIFVWFLTNTYFLYAIIDDTYYDGHLVDTLWLVSFLLWSFAIINYHRHINRNPNYDLSRKYTGSKNIRYGAINQFAIPISVGLVIMVSLIAMNFLGVFTNSENAEQLDNLAIVLLIFALMITFSGIILIVNRNLAKLVKIREDELEEKNELLLKAERFSAIGEVSARIAHDIRNPLSVMKNSVELILDRHKDHMSDLDNASVSTIKRAITRITHQVDDVLDFVKEKNLVISDHKADEMLKAAVAEVPHPENIEIEIEPTKLIINCDARQMHRVFANIILNAVQILNEGGKITIRTKEDQNWAHIEFEDTGPGVQGKLGTQVFDPLFTTKQSGTGLGLAICKRVVEQHWGKINYKNNPTVFSISLPRNLQAL